MKYKCNYCGRSIKNGHVCKYGANKYHHRKDYVCFSIERRNGEIVLFKIDKEDFDKVHKFRWSLKGGRYVSNTKNGYLHQYVFGKKEGYMVDHINGDIYDNRKSNLRYANHRQNQLNTKCKGYRFNKKSQKWVAHISVSKGVVKHLGTFETEQLARNARHNAEKKYYGSFSNHT